MYYCITLLLLLQYHKSIYSIETRLLSILLSRSASQHSKAATNAFLKGNHSSAHQHSLKAQQQWLTAQTLNAKAANDILSIRNSQNDVWNLDLHGLHAAEAIQVLQQRLHQIETRLLSNRSLSPNSLRMDSTRMTHSSSLESFDSISMEMQKLDKEHAPLRQRPTSLQVITGIIFHITLSLSLYGWKWFLINISLSRDVLASSNFAGVGNHSRGRASLPVAVRGFLNENGY